MQAAMLLEPGRLEQVELPEPPDPMAGEALVAVRRVGICGTDFHAYASTQNFFAYPRVLGHELAVEVLELGPGTADGSANGSGPVRVGDTCAVMPYLSCGACTACARGQANCCERIDVLGVTVDGGMRERLVVPVSALYPRPGLSLDQLALVETLGIGMHAVERAGPVPTDTVLIVGTGPIGLAVAQCLRDAVDRVVVSDLAPGRLAFAERTMGLAAVTAGPDLPDTLREHLDGDLPTLVFDATGSKASMEAAFELVGAGGKLVLVGHTTGPITFDNPLFHRRELDVRGSRNALASEWATVLDRVAGATLDALPWIGRRSSLAAVSDDLPELAAGTGDLVKAIVDIDPGTSPEGGPVSGAARLLRLAEGDNVYIATGPLRPGDVVRADGRDLPITEPVELGHKVAARDIEAGEKIIRFGMPIGSATRPIAAGAWVHTHNLASDYIRTFDHRGGDGHA